MAQDEKSKGHDEKKGGGGQSASASSSGKENLVTMTAFAGLSEPIAGQVQAGEEFETTQENARMYTRSRWAGAPGQSDREVQQQVAAEEIGDLRQAKTNASEARQAFRNLSPKSGERGNAAAGTGSTQISVEPTAKQDEKSGQKDSGKG